MAAAARWERGRGQGRRLQLDKNRNNPQKKNFVGNQDFNKAIKKIR